MNFSFKLRRTFALCFRVKYGLLVFAQVLHVPFHTFRRNVIRYVVEKHIRMAVVSAQRAILSSLFIISKYLISSASSLASHSSSSPALPVF
jgi:hypothetical protein